MRSEELADKEAKATVDWLPMSILEHPNNRRDALKKPPTQEAN